MLSSTTSPTLESVMTDPSFIPWSTFNLSDVVVTLLGINQDVGIISYKVEAMRSGKEYKALISSAWGKLQNGTWKMHTHQQTPY